MTNKLIFQTRNKKELFSFLDKNKKRLSLNFLNQHDVYQFKNIEKFRKAITGKNNLNMVDGFFVSLFLSLKRFKKVIRVRGPTFTKDFLSNKKLSGNKKHFFIGLEKEDLISLKKNLFHLKRLECYNPPYIKEIEFPPREIDKIAKKINLFKPDFVWVGIASPKQNIISQALFKKTKVKYFVNIGAGLDFLLGKKKEAPFLVQKLGMEWLYRLITDFKYSKKKVWRSLVGVWYLISGRVGLEVEG